MKATPSPFRAIAPSIDHYSADQLMYPGLSQTVSDHFKAEYQILVNQTDSVNHQFWIKFDTARLSRFLPPISLLMQQADTRQSQIYWSKQLSIVTSLIHGEPDPEMARILMRKSLGEILLAVRQVDVSDLNLEPMLDVYRKILGSDDVKLAQASLPESSQFLDELKAILYKKYQSVYDIIDRHFKDDDLLDVTTVHAYFVIMLNELSLRGGSWANWRVEISPGSQMAVQPTRRIVKLGESLPPLPARRVKSLFTHEVIVHAGRSVQGSNYGDKLAHGLPGYTEAEEGLGVLLEAAIDGQMPYRIVDRYIDISLAMGTLGLPSLSRPELYELVLARSALRWRAEGAEPETEILEAAAWHHVNRVYKGSLGNDIVGVNTKDVVYYNGYKSMYEYLSRFKDSDLEKALHFSLSGKINPVNQQHRSYIHDIKFNVSRSN